MPRSTPKTATINTPRGLGSAAEVPRVSVVPDPRTLIRQLDVRLGHRVLEIGAPSSGQTTALLAELIGHTGNVVSVTPGDVDRGGSFDRLVAWKPSRTLPSSWTEQLSPGGVLVAPVPVAPLATADGVARVELDQEGRPELTTVLPGAFLGWPEGLDGVPELFVDTATRRSDGWWWVSAEWLHGRDEDAAAEVLTLLHTEHRFRPSPLRADEDARALIGYLLAMRLDGMLTAGMGDLLPGIGCALPGSVVVLSGDQLVVGGTDESCAGLMDWIEEWRQAGRPGIAAFRPRLERRNAGWEIRFTRDLDKD